MIRKALSLILATSLMTQTAFAARPQLNIWEERQQRTPASPSSPEPLKLAALPMPMTVSLNEAIVPSPTLLAPVPVSIHSMAVGTSVLRSLAPTIAAANATVQEIHDDSGSRQTPVIIVQDIHMNAEAQTNIAAVLDNLMQTHQISAVYVEGAFDRFNFAPFRSFPDAKIRREVAASYLAAAKLAAPSYAGITSRIEPPLFRGVDDRISYAANVRAYLESRPLKDRVQRALRAREQNTRLAKAKAFSAPLRRFDDLRTSYHSGALGLSAYAPKLLAFTDADSAPLCLIQFAEAARLEKTLDFHRINTERRTVLTELTRKLNPTDTQTLIAQSVAYREGKLGFGAYYTSFRDLCARRGVALSRAPMFNTYIQYVMLSDGIQAEKLFAELSEVETAVAARLARSPAEKELMETSEAQQLATKLTNFELSAAEWTRYQQLERPLPELATFESFYTNADARSKKMVENLTTHTTGTAPAVLIVGGFHTPEIAEKLRQRKTPYMILSPKITKISADGGSAYLSVFAQEKTPLNKLFRAEKLFINPTAVNITDPDLSRELLSSMNDRLSGGRILWLRALIMNLLDIPQAHYDRYLEFIENGLTLAVGAAVLAVGLGAAQIFGLHTSYFWNAPVFTALAYSIGSLFFLIAHAPRFNSGLSPPGEAPRLGYAALIAAANVLLFSPLLIPSLNLSVPILVQVGVISLLWSWSWLFHGVVNEWAQEREPRRRTVESIIESLRPSDLEEIHTELWSVSDAYRKLFSRKNIHPTPNQIGRAWRKIFFSKQSLTTNAGNDLTPGQDVGTYTIERKFTRGGMGSIYFARNASGEQVILKTVPGDSGTALEDFIVFAAALRNEEKIMRHIMSQKNAQDIAPPLLGSGFDKSAGHFYLAMGIVPGQSIFRLIDANTVLDADGHPHKGVLTLTDIQRLLELLSRLHSAGVIHGDIQPGNIMVTSRPDGSRDFMFVDFGGSKLLEATRKGPTFLDQIFLEKYVSPSKRRTGATVATDIYSISQIAKLHLQPADREWPMIPALISDMMRDGLETSAAELALQWGQQTVRSERTEYGEEDPFADLDGNYDEEELMPEEGFSQWQPATLFHPLRFQKSLRRLTVWERGISPLWEEAVFAALAVATGQLWIFLIGRLLFVVMHGRKQTRDMAAPLVVSVLVALIVGSVTGFDLSTISIPNLLKIYVGSVAVHSGVNTLVTARRNAQLQMAARALIEQALTPTETNATDLLDRLMKERPDSLDDVFSPRQRQPSLYIQSIRNEPEIFITVLKAELEKRIKKQPADTVSQALVLQRLALLGVNAKTLGDIANSFLKSTTHLNVILDGTNTTKDIVKLISLRDMVRFSGRTDIMIHAFVNDEASARAMPRIPGVTVRVQPREAVVNGELLMDRLLPAGSVDEGTRHQWLRGLGRARFVVPVGFTATFGVSGEFLADEWAATEGLTKDKILKNLSVAFINDLLQVRVLDGPMLNAMDRVARAVMTAA